MTVVGRALAGQAEEQAADPIGADDLVAGGAGGDEGAQRAGVIGAVHRPRAAFLDVAAGPRRELATRLLRLAQDAGDLGVAVVEDLGQQEGGALGRGQPLEQEQERHRQVRRVGLGPGDIGGRPQHAIGDAV